MLMFLFFEMRDVSSLYLNYWDSYRYLSDAVSNPPH